MSNTYCTALFNHIYLNNGGKYKLCCDAGLSEEKISTASTPFEYFLSEEMEEKRNKVLCGEKLTECRGCYRKEEMGYKSPRQWRFKSDNIKITEVGNVELKLRMWGNHCNLACYTCFPHNSSTRAAELKEIGKGYYERFNRMDYEKPPSPKQYDRIVEDILNNIHLVESIIITGGEPLLLPRQFKFIDAIPEEHAKRISITYITNFTSLWYKDIYFLDKVRRFKGVFFSISCDHYQDKLSYIRYPINIKQFESNLRILKQEMTENKMFDGAISITASILNAEDLDDIIRYYENNFGLNAGIGAVVDRPNEFAIRNHIKKEQLISKYRGRVGKGFDQVNGQLAKPHEAGMWNKAIDFFNDLDQHRGIKYKDMWPDYDYVDP